MIHEYALEPEVVASWHDRAKFRFFIDQFGYGAGRVVGMYPSKTNWRKHVWAALDTDFSPTDKDRMRMVEIVKKLIAAKVQRVGSEWNGTLDWLTNAESEHLRKPFHAILARENPRNNGTVMLEADILEGEAAGWNAPHSIVVQRSAENMAECVAPMLRCATRVLFVDPYFRAKKQRFRAPLAAFLRKVSPQAKLEVHTSASYDEAPSGEHFRNESERDLQRHSVIPGGLELKVYRWRNREGGEKMHNRYVLTDIGGVQFGTGLDEGEEGTTDLVSRLSAGPYEKLYQDYAGPGFSFDLDGEPFLVPSNQERT